jgi:hypothetical protein
MSPMVRRIIVVSSSRHGKITNREGFRRECSGVGQDDQGETVRGKSLCRACRSFSRHVGSAGCVWVILRKRGLLSTFGEC